MQKSIHQEVLACKPLSGSIYFGDIDINKILFESIEQKVGIVLQAPPMFGLTIRRICSLPKSMLHMKSSLLGAKRLTSLKLLAVCPTALNCYWRTGHKAIWALEAEIVNRSNTLKESRYHYF